MRDKILEFMSQTMTSADDTIESYVEDCKKTFSQASKSPEELNELLDAIRESLKQEKDNIINDTISVIGKHLDEATLDGVNAYFKTPAFQALREATPKVQSEIRESTDKWITVAMNRVEPLMTKMFGSPEPASLPIETKPSLGEVPAVEHDNFDDEPTAA